jgi:hypothetical protein
MSSIKCLVLKQVSFCSAKKIAQSCNNTPGTTGKPFLCTRVTKSRRSVCNKCIFEELCKPEIMWTNFFEVKF